MSNLKIKPSILLKIRFFLPIWFFAFVIFISAFLGRDLKCPKNGSLALGIIYFIHLENVNKISNKNSIIFEKAFFDIFIFNPL
jgi:hypothetical protein